MPTADRATPNVQVHLPGGHRVDIALVLAYGEMASGLLGTTSLTYQLVGRVGSLAHELVDRQPEMRVMVGGAGAGWGEGCLPYN